MDLVLSRRRLAFPALPVTIAYVWLCVTALSVAAQSSTYYIDFNSGSSGGSGSASSPWDSIATALERVADGSTVIVREGTYTGRTRLRGVFPQGVVFRAETPYQARLRNNDRVITAYKNNDGCSGITLEGFDIAHSGTGASALVVHIDGGGDHSVQHITLKNNILHDSYNNDILKINNSVSHITVEGNMFYNQTGSDEHIDINSAEDIVVRGNIFFNDFEGSGRNNSNNTSSYIVVKDSNGESDAVLGSRRIYIQRNVFFNWQGSSGSNFVLIGEDGKPFYEAESVLVENNLMLGNSSHTMRAAFGVKGGRDITFRCNTVAGNLPALAFAFRLNREGSNLANQNIVFYNNIWSDPTSTMGAGSSGGSDDFSDTPPSDTSSFTIDNNLYFNGSDAVPSDSSELINYTDDANRVVGDPDLADNSGVVLPRWNSSNGRFADGSIRIQGVFEHLARTYGEPGSGSAALRAGNSAQTPAVDILGRTRPSGAADVGAFQLTDVEDIKPSAPDNLRISN